MAPKKKTEAEQPKTVGGQPRTSRVKGAERSARAGKGGKMTEAAHRRLAHEAFLLSSKGYGVRDIGQALGINKDTASKYVREETERLRERLQSDRDTQAAEAIAFYDEIAVLGIELARKSTDAFMQPLVKGLDAAVKARERKDKILGLDAPTKIDLGLQKLFAAFDEE